MLRSLFYHTDNHALCFVLFFLISRFKLGALDISESVVISVVVLFDAAVFKANLNTIPLLVEIFLGNVVTVAVPDVEEFIENMYVKKLQRSSAPRK